MDPFDAVRSLVMSRLKTVMAAVGAETRDDIKNSINTPYPPASDPYSPPHRRLGRLHEGVTHSQEMLPDRIRETLQSVRVPESRKGAIWEVPQLLEQTGTPNMAPRPYMFPALQRVTKTVLPNVAGKMKL